MIRSIGIRPGVIRPVVIRPMGAQDLAPVLRLVQPVPEAPAWTTEEFRKLVAASPLPSLSLECFAPQAALLRSAWVAEANAQLLGLIVVQCLCYPAGEGPAAQPVAECEVESIVVHPDARRLGIGRQLLATTVEWCRSRNASVLRLEVRRSNQGAVRLYEAAGFVLAGVRPRYYQSPDEDAILMQCNLV